MKKNMICVLYICIKRERENIYAFKDLNYFVVVVIVLLLLISQSNNHSNILIPSKREREKIKKKMYSEFFLFLTN